MDKFVAQGQYFINRYFFESSIQVVMSLMVLMKSWKCSTKVVKAPTKPSFQRRSQKWFYFMVRTSLTIPKLLTDGYNHPSVSTSDIKERVRQLHLEDIQLRIFKKFKRYNFLSEKTKIFISSMQSVVLIWLVSTSVENMHLHQELKFVVNEPRLWRYWMVMMSKFLGESRLIKV